MLTRQRLTFRHTTAMATIGLGLLLLTAPLAHADSRTYTFDIPAETAAQALNDFGKQAGVQILFPYDAASQFTIKPVKGSFTRAEALTRILQGTGLEIATETDTSITLRLARTASGPAVPEPATEVIVTGTHIRGANPTSPVHTVTRKDIDVSGFSQIGDVMRSLPENFSGGQNPGVIGATFGNSANYNGSNASTVNLRGLGTDATLVVVNGHRLAGDMYYQGADISGIPLSAVQRVEVVTDGASALYGADAVAGVVNFVLRKNYDGAEVSGRIGAATQGGAEEHTFSVLAGRSGVNSYILGSLEISDQKAVTTSQRDFTSAAEAENTLLQPSRRNALFVSAGHTFTDRVSVSADLLLSDRQTSGESQQTASAARYFTDVYTPSFSLAITANLALGDRWKSRVTAVATGSRNSFTASLPAYAYTNTTIYKNYAQYFEVTADGPLVTLPSGDVKLAVGAGHRSDGFRNGTPGSGGAFERTRNVDYAYAELLAPLVTPSEQRRGLEALELNLSARAENYSDFGSSTNPKIGLRYVPVAGLALRGTWGTSFKAPSFVQMYSENPLYLWNAADVGGTGVGTVLMTYGGNPDLKPETSESWTLGGDFTPSGSLRLSATWFGISYDDRVVQPVARYLNGLSNPVYAPFIEGTPSSARQAELVSQASSFVNFSSGPYDPATVVAVIRDQYTNASAQSVSGVDVSYRQSVELPVGQLTLFGNATWLRLNQQTIATEPSARLSGTLFNVPKLKSRAGATWEQGGLSATLIANYTGEETDNAITPNRDVASWTTVDATVSYASAAGGHGLRISLSAINLFDRDPPHAYGPAASFPGLAFDSTNASILGRFVSLTIAKAW